MKIIQEIHFEGDVQWTRLTVYNPSEMLRIKLKKKYEKHIVPHADKKSMCSFLFKKTIPKPKLQFAPRTLTEKKFFESLQKFFTREKRNCQSKEDIQVMVKILNSFLSQPDISKTWTNFKIYLQSELKK